MQNPEFVTQHWGLFHTQAACPQAFTAFRLNWVISGRLGGGGWGGGGYSWTKDKSIVTRTAFHSYKCVTSLSSGFLTSLTSQERKNKSCSECECVCACVCVYESVLTTTFPSAPSALSWLCFPFDHFCRIKLWPTTSLNRAAFVDKTSLPYAWATVLL